MTNDEFYVKYQDYENDKILQDAIIELEYAVRWFYHIFCTVNSNRWDSYYKWKQIIDGWSWKQAYEDGVKYSFPFGRFWKDCFKSLWYLYLKYFVIGIDKSEWIENDQ